MIKYLLLFWVAALGFSCSQNKGEVEEPSVPLNVVDSIEIKDKYPGYE